MLPIDAVEIIHMPFVTPNAQRYLHLSNTRNLDYSPNDFNVTENSSGLPIDAIYRFGTSELWWSLLNHKLQEFAPLIK
jgi:hypothetical protein